MRKFLFDIFKRFKRLRRVARFVLLILRRIRFIILNLGNPVDDKTVLFEVFSGRTFADSPKALYLEMINDPRYKDYKRIWVFQNPEEKKDFFHDPNTKLVKRKSRAYYKAYGKAKYWVVNFREPNELRKKANQVYVQCWHGTPLKKLGHDIVAEGASLNSTKEIYYNYDKDTKRIDNILSPSAYTTEKLTSAFNLKAFDKEDIIIEEGYPRNDKLFNYSEDDIQIIKNQFGLPNDKKVILYAPTFRDNQHKSGVGYSYKIELNFDRLKEEIGSEYVVLFRAHYFVLDSIDLSKYEGFIFDASSYDDPNDLYIVSDLLITDYSSVFFDFANLKRPMIFYMYDKDAYKENLRDFYISLDGLPGPVTENEDDLIKAIKNVDSDRINYAQKYDEFNQTYNYLDDGQASERVLAKIIFGKKLIHSSKVIFKRRVKKMVKSTINLVNRKIPGTRYMVNKRIEKQKLRRQEKFIQEYEVNDKIIIFEAYMGRSYACSPKAIYEYMVSSGEFDDYRLIWALRDKVNRDKLFVYEPYLRKAEITRYGSEEYYRLYAQAKYIFSNSRLSWYIMKRPEQVYVQCWHGTPLKRLRYDIEVKGHNALYTKNDLEEKYDKDAKRYDYLLSASAYMSEKMRSAFDLARVNPDVEIIEKGYPRNDFLFNYTEEHVTLIRKVIGIPEDDKRKLILYAPTWRDNQHTIGLGYSLDLGFDFDRLREELEDEFIFLFKPHYFVANNFDFDKYEGFVYNVSSFGDINHLYILADILMTDYSSVLFDYANLKRPMIFYMYDIEEYADVIRGFYFDINELPGPIITKEDELISEIKKQGVRVDDGSWKEIDEKYKAFNAKFTYLDDGKASVRVINEVMEK